MSIIIYIISLVIIPITQIHVFWIHVLCPLTNGHLHLKGIQCLHLQGHCFIQRLRHNRLLKLPKYVNHISKTQINHSSISSEVYILMPTRISNQSIKKKRLFVSWNSPCNKTKMVWDVDTPTTRRDLHIRVLQQYLQKHNARKLQETPSVFITNSVHFSTLFNFDHLSVH